MTIELEGQPSLHFQLHAALVEPDPNLPRQFDFGGVEVGATRSLTAPALIGLTDDFSQANGQLTYAPVDAGVVQLAATRESMLDCPALGGVTVFADGVPAVLAGPTQVNFGDVVVGNAIELDVSVQNLSFDEVKITLPVSDFTIVSMSTTPSVATRDQRGVLVPGRRTQLIHYSPTMPGAVTGQLEAVAGNRRLVIPLRAVAVP